MTIDVIIPVYNQFEFVRNCVDSIEKSRCATPFDIVVVDDASTDENLKKHLRALADAGAIRLYTNAENLGFTRTVNFAMQIDRDRDVLLLNSDTLVYGDWLDRIARGARADDRIGTANPLTNNHGSHIGSYPDHGFVSDVTLEVDGETLGAMAEEVNDGKSALVHTTVGFCMYIKRACLDAVGYFDSVNFPVGYGEESDFCYRARKAGWRHVIVGDAFVTHLEGKSFGERKQKLMNDMFEKFGRLHPECQALDKDFRDRDPLRGMRAGLDLARVKALLAGRGELTLEVVPDIEKPGVAGDAFRLVCAEAGNRMRIAAKDAALFPNLETWAIPADMLKLNRELRYLGVRKIVCRSERDRDLLAKALAGRPFEIALEAELTLAS